MSLSRFAVIGVLLLVGGCSPNPTAPDLCSSEEPPSPPSQLTAIPGPGAITLHWVKPTFATTRILRRFTSPPTAPDDTAAVVIYDGPGTTATDTALAVGASYEYRAWSRSACNPTLYSTSSATASSTPLMPGPPPPPRSLAVDPGPHWLRLVWLNPTIGSFAGVVIRRSDSGFPTGPDDGVLAFEGMARTFVDDSLSPETTYYYAVYSRDGYGQLSSEAAHISGVPEWIYQDIEVPPFDVWERFPSLRCSFGDCDFAGHGPDVQLAVELKRNLLDFWVLVTSFRAVETDGDLSCIQRDDMEESWGSNVYRADLEGWIFDSYPSLPSVVENLQYIDQSLTMDYRYGRHIIDYVAVMGETAGYDFCTRDEDDTHLHRLHTRPITVRVRR